jgi:GT2 family glycosyltransferase
MVLNSALRSLLVVILNFNGIEDTLACLDSLQKQTFRDFETLVIDNGSRMDDLTRIKDAFPETQLIALSENLGWAGGNNVGIRFAQDQGFRYVCLLNNDTIVDPTAIAELLDAAESIGGPSLLHPTIAYFDDPSKWQLNPERDASDNETLSDLVKLDFAYGACLMFPISVPRTIGLLDERFFLQLEETDYYERARKLSIPSICVKRARILHKVSASFGSEITDSKTYYQVRNRLLFTQKHTPTLKGFLHATRGLMWTLHIQARQSGADLNSWLDFTRWITSAHPLARAARQGGLDYVRRRFGPRRKSSGGV